MKLTSEQRHTLKMFEAIRDEVVASEFGKGEPEDAGEYLACAQQALRSLEQAILARNPKDALTELAVIAATATVFAVTFIAFIPADEIAKRN